MDHSQRPKRTSNACQRCRSRKVKCTGTHPCDKCCQRREDCVFEDDRKIVVSEELFLSLKRKVEALEKSGDSSPVVKRRRAVTADSANESSYEPASELAREASLDPVESHRMDDHFTSNPFINPGYLKHTGRRQRIWLFLGPTSTWSFSRRILTIVQAHISPESPRAIPLAVDGDAYQIQWRHASSEEAPDISGLPSLEHALYMVSTVQFHFTHLYRLFDEDEFYRHLYEFYDDAAAKVQERRLWYVQFLIILAFGEAFLDPVRNHTNTAGWTKYFSRAMSLLPDITGLWQDPTLAIEVLALIGLYFHSVDMRDTAYCYIGHSMRMALVEGFHRALPVNQLGRKLVERCSNIWWTVYILDRKFAALIGSPNSVRDDEITTLLWDPRTCSRNEATLSLHVKITQVITRVLNTVYSADGTLGGVFLRKVRSVLQEMTTLSQELDEVFTNRFANSVDSLSGVTTRLTLSCHLCIIVTTRPLVLSLLWERLGCFEAGTEFRTLSPPVQALLQACIDSATKSLRILTALRDQNLLETFLPFDLENLFSSFFILSVISAILPDTLTDPSYRDMGYSLLDAMIERGNRVAQLRRSEVELLEELIAPLMQRQGRSPDIGNYDSARPHLATPTSQGQERHTEQIEPSESGLHGEIGGSGIPPPHEISEQDDEIALDWRGLGLSLDCMLTAADQLNTNNLVLDAEREGLQTDLWLWES
ncbi:transcriptional regulator family: Fungal Specific TF [Aspergillus niger]|uniref:C6 transcription factor n=1 Tax=Aspergillus niger ATCC 13496 TaxID=1353008 RepID=A0A370BZW3_ASPNG|nr:C6 transcription factor [Aspergillus niger CBS 513.88]XP_025453253.1 C6 transcription factor [Aspergillus niger CBS 101883]KAI2823393.1 transcriptional regulator family: Fungal Specific TF [Aspergillus niger]RDH19615.1 C6 transcription factor [Aspergillus niger ATCC 13496]KAI2857664.1 transcriptional regulator family: Fungal Specific TF [Aspergillus niger]KAI2877876.1 transcriptional regulator family: Fungal Specific TF [Aspergillus niger]KAI2889730.1 transcriptional regulator family: Fung|eukprot:XP_001389978.2 C6 transcription factor [Aspergillus niger CBS 513.88]